MGVELGDFSAHSYRKVVGTMVVVGYTVYPYIASICVRAWCTMGGINDKYLKREIWEISILVDALAVWIS